MDKVLEKLSELDKKLDVFVVDTKHAFLAIELLDKHQNGILADHVRRSEALEASNVLLEKKIDSEILRLNKPLELISLLIKVVIGLGSLAASLSAITFFISYLK